MFFEALKGVGNPVCGSFRGREYSAATKVRMWAEIWGGMKNEEQEMWLGSFRARGACEIYDKTDRGVVSLLNEI